MDPATLYSTQVRSCALLALNDEDLKHSACIDFQYSIHFCWCIPAFCVTQEFFSWISHFLIDNPQDKVRQATAEMLQGFGTQHYIANLGHGLFKDTEIKSVTEFVNSVHDISEKMIKGVTENGDQVKEALM